MSDPNHKHLDASARLWHYSHETPPYTHNLVTLIPDQTISHLSTISALRSTFNTSWAAKDSFAALDLNPLGFKVLFEARWLWLDPDQPLSTQRATIKWSPVRHDPDLEAWEQSWRTHQDANTQRLFPSRLLDPEEVSIVAGCDGSTDDTSIIAGFVTCRSDGVTGISNLFGPNGWEEETRVTATKLVRNLISGLPIVDYGQVGSKELVVAERLGYEVVGPLKVWSC